ncbi:MULTISPECIES: hypothetical protein [Fischerella]|uniref:hypothetical protein n=1 Tax=Fischerella sp. FACHB-380 TaxID=2692799 RepID=UPI0003678729|nr:MULTISPECIES: hypothetical protein [Fischerella]
MKPLAETWTKLLERAVRAFDLTNWELICIKTPAPPPLFQDCYWEDMYKAGQFCLIVFEPHSHARSPLMKLSQVEVYRLVHVLRDQLVVGLGFLQIVAHSCDI